jgi:hypothetical protein
MNPLSLLRKGRTIKGGKDRTTYKLPKGGTPLPNFSANKPSASPTSSHPQEEPKVMQAGLFENSAHQPPTPAPVRAATFAPMQKPDQAVEKAPAEIPAREPGPGFGMRFSAWLCNLPHRWFSKRKTSPFQSRTVQTELALEKVIVKRNDLSEEDLEIVPIGKKAKEKSDKPDKLDKTEKPPEQPVPHDQCQTISTNR